MADIELRNLINEIREVEHKTELPTMRILAFVCVNSISRKIVAKDYDAALEDATILLEVVKILATGSDG